MQRSRRFGELIVHLDFAAGEARKKGFEVLAKYIEDVLIPFFVKEQLAAAIEEGSLRLGVNATPVTRAPVQHHLPTRWPGFLQKTNSERRMMGTDVYRVHPFVLRKALDEQRELVVMTDVDGCNALLVPVTEEAAEEANGVHPGFEARPVTVEEIEHVCAIHGLALVGFWGFEPNSLDVVSVETVGMILEEGE